MNFQFYHSPATIKKYIKKDVFLEYTKLIIKNLNQFNLIVVHTSSGIFWDYTNNISSSITALHIFYPCIKNYYLYTFFYLDLSYKYYMSVVLIDNINKNINITINNFFMYHECFKFLIKKSGYNKAHIKTILELFNKKKIIISKEQITNIINDFINYINSLRLLQTLK